MLTKTIALNATPVTVASLLDASYTRINGMALQAPATNAADAYFGGSGGQVAFIPPGSSSDVLPVRRTTDILVKGTVGDNLIVMTF